MRSGDSRAARLLSSQGQAEWDPISGEYYAPASGLQGERRPGGVGRLAGPYGVSHTGPVRRPASRMDSSVRARRHWWGRRILSSTYFLLTSMYGSGGRGSIATLMTRNGSGCSVSSPLPMYVPPQTRKWCRSTQRRPSGTTRCSLGLACLRSLMALQRPCWSGNSSPSSVLPGCWAQPPE